MKSEADLGMMQPATTLSPVQIEKKEAWVNDKKPTLR